MKRQNYFDSNPIQNKAIAKDCEPIFCKTYADKIRLANAINNNGKNHIHIVKIGGKQSVIILN